MHLCHPIGAEWRHGRNGLSHHGRPVIMFVITNLFRRQLVRFTFPLAFRGRFIVVVVTAASFGISGVRWTVQHSGLLFPLCLFVVRRRLQSND